MVDPGDSCYLITYEGGSMWLYPTTVGHYGVKLASGVVLQLKRPVWRRGGRERYKGPLSRACSWA